jgi:rubrerythrin
MAYSGELAAGYAYSAHLRSISDPAQRSGIQKIENEEWEHRKLVGDMLAFLGDGPQPLREIMMATIGRTVGIACFLIGWFLPMYFAGRLESANIKEYENASYYATQLGLNDFAEQLLHLASVEREHEEFFLNMVTGHYLLPLTKAIFKWGP